MSELLTILALAGTPIGLVLAWVAVDERLAERADRKRRAEQEREVTPEWLAVLAAVEPTPVYDALVCEHMERAEGWSA